MIRLVFCVVSCATAGCVASAPTGGSWASQGGILGGSQVAESSGSLGDRIMQYHAAKPRPDQWLVSSVRGVSSKVSQALSIEPRIVPAADPIRLDSAVPTVGADLHIQAARVHESRGDIAGALAQYQRALEAAPQDPRTLVAIARLHDRNGDWDSAETFYLQASHSDPGCTGVFNDLALCYARQEKWDQALQSLQFAIQQDPSNPRYRNNIAAILIVLGRIDEAREQLASVYPLPITHYNVGYLLSRQGQSELAARELQAALRADPSLEAAKQLLASMGADNQFRATLASNARRTGTAAAKVSPGMRRLPPVAN